MSDRELASILAELSPPFDVERPTRQTSPVVFCSPHSGRIYPRTFLEESQLDPLALRRSEDCYVDELLASVPAFGAPLLAARFPRAYLDVNREPYELDPELFDEPLPEFANAQTMRVVGGLGTIARIVAENEQIYSGPISLDSAYARIDHLYKPFHATLRDLLEQTRAQFGYAILIDCHSMPSASTNYPAAVRPAFVIGDRYGTSCGARITRSLRDILRLQGHHAQLNRPYAGGFITEYYGRPNHAIHAVQIEINRGLYLNEGSLARSEAFCRFLQIMTEIIERIVVQLPAAVESRAAAE
ncbi:MAG: N-formylglutamate amidohydrolase [Hyphomicrobiaceae bacterium]